MPDLKEIQHLKGQQFQHEWNSTHFSEMSLMSIIEQDVPREPSTDLVVGAYMGGLIYCGHCRDEEFVISTFHGRTGFEEEVTLNPDDALRVLKSIYYYSGNKDFLDRVYVVARTVNATLRPQEGY
jgi:hypothetical protein